MPGPLVAAAGAAVALVLVVAVVPPGPGVPAFVLHIAEVLLAGGAAYAVDDASVALTGVTPRPLWRRRLPTLAVTGAVIGTAAAAIALVLHWQRSLPGLLPLAAEVLVLCLVATAAASVVARHGDPEPGVLVAPVVALVGFAVLIAGPLLHTAPFLTDGDTGRAWWFAAGALALATIATATRDPVARSMTLWVRSPRPRSNDSGSA